MKTLAIIAHPNISESVINKHLVHTLSSHPDTVTIHHLYDQYPDWNIDVKAEQQLVEQHDRILFQFPFYWFSCPPLLRKWMDDVLTYGWAYGRTGDKVKNKQLLLAVSAGIEQDDYKQGGKYLYTMKELLRPFELTALYTDMIYKTPFVVYDTDNQTGQDLARISQEYTAFLEIPCAAGTAC
ncbi:NAD(P)H-dependent oxidoreductase [Chitinophaga pendula]|uniref:NAD(P)H-dependent oxidoreductase n=1 Tax=Chitinophaga TaxID=79328 RepID=UPI000BB097A8|nr:MULTISPECIES: NAD(P)H-dependent oxidoreductase [Chitinophaga]ASZ14761.1 NAD(P)H oxidoreductase [Chitinophaga sp. MD30]UCJ07343.1 NAD(P)H-dependent oxidoreductase [Chitinophaga pendula]